MSRNSTPDPCLERHVRRDSNHPDVPLGRTTTPIERPLTAAQARGQRLASQELLENIEETLGEETVEDEAAGPEPPLAEPLESLQTSQEEILNLEL